MKYRTSFYAIALAFLAGIPLAAAAEERISRADDREEVAVTIYNESLALIKEVRRIAFDRGANSIALRDVSAKMRPETASLRALSRRQSAPDRTEFRLRPVDAAEIAGEICWAFDYRHPHKSGHWRRDA